jgi:signal transduction histidine kinase
MLTPSRLPIRLFMGKNRSMPLLRRILIAFAHAAFHGLRLGLLGFLFALLPAQATTVVNRASATFELDHESTARAPADVKLPFNWNSALGGASGKARFTLRFAADPNGPQQALFVRRIGNAFELTFNGEPLAKAGVFGGLYTDSSTRPQLIIIPPSLLRADNVVTITIGAQSGRNAGVGAIYAGNVDEMRTLYRQAYRWRNSAYLLIGTVSALLGGLAFLLWLRQRDPLYLYYALSELLWAIHLADIQFETTPLPWPWWGIFSYSCYAVACGFICKFSLTLVEKFNGRNTRLVNLQLWLSVPVVALAFLSRHPGLISLWLGLTVLLGSFVAVVVIRQGVQTRSVEQRVLAIAVCITIAAAIRDLYVFRILAHYGGFPTLIFAWTGFGIAMAWIIAERLRKSTQAVADMNRTLAERLAQREEELGALFASQASRDRHQAITEERQRIMRDMHDGLGSQLVSAVHLIKDPNVPRDMLVEQLQDALDNLKLTVDAMQETDGDIAVLLGALRYRLAPRFEAIGVALSWEVQPLPVVQDWTIQKSRHLQLILFEAISNVIAHAKATRAHLSAQHRHDGDDEEIIISLKDNGTGFRAGDGAGASGHGLANMRARAASIGAAIDIMSSADGTQLHLTLPVQTIRQAG